MYAYKPPFDCEAVLSLARRRDMISSDETLVMGLDRLVRELAVTDRRFGGTGNREFKRRLRAALYSGRVFPSSQLLSGIGRTSAVSACTVLPTAGPDDESRLARVVVEMELASRKGMGCGIDVTDFRDPVNALSALNEAGRRLNKHLMEENRRPPALMVTCRARHPKAVAFAAAKRNADLSRWVANISLLFSSDIAEWSALAPIVAECAHQNGEPGILFQSVADDDNPTPEIELISTAPCAEVFLAIGERCVFFSVNLAAHVREGEFDWALFEASVRIAVRAGDAAAEIATISAPPVVGLRRRIGVGVCGFHSAIIARCLPYALSIPFAEAIAERLTFFAHSESAILAASRGPFPAWEGSRWRNVDWMRRKILLRRGHVDPAMWNDLEKAVLKRGIRNAAVVAFPPTGVVAEVLGVSRSYEPHFCLAGQTGLASRRALRVVPEAAAALRGHPREAEIIAEILNPSTGHQVRNARPEDLLACARQLPIASHIGVHAAFSLLADEAGSKTVNLAANTTVADIERLFWDARRLGLKGLTVFRDGCLDQLKQAS